MGYSAGATYFPEPDEGVDALSAWQRTPEDWLDTVATPRARAIRSFLNRSLALFPPGYAKSLSKKLRTDWDGHYFELVVGLFLMALGADVEPEVPGSNGTNIDFQATFPDGVVSVEAHAKEYHRAMKAAMERQRPVLDHLSHLTPPDWAMLVDRLPSPAVVGDASFERELAAAFATLPAALAPEDRLPLRVTHGGETLVGEMVFRPGRVDGVWVSPGLTEFGHRWDDSAERIRYALRDNRKRRQAQAARRPVLLAMVGGMLTDIDDFDMELLGRTTEVWDYNPNGQGLSRIGQTFDPTGVLCDPDCPWDGVLVFPRLGVFDAAEPHLYLSPRLHGRLPVPFDRLEQRLVGTDGLVVTPATHSVMSDIDFAEPK